MVNALSVKFNSLRTRRNMERVEEEAKRRIYLPVVKIIQGKATIVDTWYYDIATQQSSQARKGAKREDPKETGTTPLGTN